MTAGAHAMKAMSFRGFLALQELARPLGCMRLRPLRKLARSAYRRLACDGSQSVRCAGLRWTIEPVADGYFSESLVIEGAHEPYETEFFLNWLRPGMTVVDIGAHVGWYALQAARRVGPSGRVVAFEPEPKNRELLRRNIAVNAVANIEVVPLAVADRQGWMPLALDPSNAGAHWLRAGAEDGAASVAVELTTLDAWCAGWVQPPDALKIDVEGAELLIWQGMRQMLAQSPRIRIMAEFYPDALRRAGTDPSALFEAFRADGFTVQRLHGESQRLLPTDYEELLAVCASGDRHTNVFLTRQPAIMGEP